MTGRYTLNDDAVWGLKKVLKRLKNLVETTDICNPFINEDFREFLIRECKMTEKQIEEEYGDLQKR